MEIVIGVGIGFAAWVPVRCVLTGFYAVDQNERAVKTVFGRAQRVGNLTTLGDPIADSLRMTRKNDTVSSSQSYYAGRPVLQVALGRGAYGLDRDGNGQYGIRSGIAPGE